MYPNTGVYKKKGMKKGRYVGPGVGALVNGVGVTEEGKTTGLEGCAKDEALNSIDISINRNHIGVSTTNDNNSTNVSTNNDNISMYESTASENHSIGANNGDNDDIKNENMEINNSNVPRVSTNTCS
jgi:hypothetical protein